MKCENCGTTKNIRQFYPPDGQDEDDQWVYFCENCFLSDLVECSEPMSYEEKIQEWNNAKEIIITNQLKVMIELSDEIKQPYWNRIKELCQLKIEEKYPKYGNSWVNFFDDKFWNERLQGEVDESKEISSFDQDGRMEELIDIINVCAMQITNLIESKQHETVMMRLGF